MARIRFRPPAARASIDLDRAATGWEIFPGPQGNSGSGLTLTSGRQVYTFFRAWSTAAVSTVKLSIGTASTTTTHAWVGVYDVDASLQPTTLLASSADLTAFATSGFQSIYKTSSINNTFTISWTPTALYKVYALGLLWTGTGSPAIRGRIIDGGSTEAGYSTVAGTAFSALSNATGLSALVPTGAPAETQANLRTNSQGTQINAYFA